MENTIEMIKEKAQRYKTLVLRNDEILKEYNNWSELHKDVQKVLAEAKEVYEKEQTEEAKEAYESWKREEQDYLEMIEEYSLKLEEINNELDEYEVNTMEEQAKYLSDLTKFQTISKMMKDIEKKSLKLAGNATIGTNIVMVENAEGRKKKINENFSVDYANLAKQKRELAKVIRKEYNTIINKVEEEEKVVEVVVKTEELKAPEQTPEPELVNIEKTNYEDLSIEDKIKQLEEKMEYYKNASGRKQRVKYCGETIVLPRRFVGAYLMCASELKKLNKQLENPTQAYSEKMNNLFYQALDAEKYTKEDKEFKSDDSLSKEYYEKLQKENEEYEKETDMILPLVNKHSGQAMRIKAIKKAEKIDKLKAKILKNITMIACGALVLTSVITSSILSKYVKKEEVNDIPDDKIVSEVTDEALKEQQEALEKFEEPSQKAESVIRLGDKFCVAEGSKIYDSMYDATLNRDAKRAYFSPNYERFVGGVSINYEGQLYFFYNTDQNAQENVDTLLANGGKITSVLGEVASGYEGFYQIDNVKSLDNTMGGISR